MKHHPFFYEFSLVPFVKRQGVSRIWLVNDKLGDIFLVQAK
jgi:hypothetical protein